MEIYSIKDLTFYYTKTEYPVLDRISLSVNEGEFIVICGKSGSGKTTLLRHLKTILSPVGKCIGEVFFKGKPILDSSPLEQASQIGFVFQNPDNQIVTDKVWHELAFGLESLGISKEKIRTAVAEMTSFFGLNDIFYSNVSQLSGGQKQTICLASVLAMNPDVIILDEPTAQLDPISASEFISLLNKINKEFGITIIISEHRLEELLPTCDRIVFMDEGKILFEQPTENLGSFLQGENKHFLKYMSTPLIVYGLVDGTGKYPLTIKDAKHWLKEFTKNKGLKPLENVKVDNNTTTSIIELQNVFFRFNKNGQDIIKDLCIDIYEGEIYSIVGANGAGKTTALSLISGLNNPYSGTILINGKKRDFDHIICSLPQDPKTLFVHDMVFKELFDAIETANPEQKEEIISQIVKLCQLDKLLDSHPYDLSSGEQQRLAIAKVLLQSPDILLLDEPTKGLDAEFKEVLSEILKDLCKQKKTVVMVSHDLEFCAKISHRCGMFFDGSITAQSTPKELFSENHFYTTAANKIAGDVLPFAVTAEDLILSCGGSMDFGLPSKKEKIPIINNEKILGQNLDLQKTKHQAKSLITLAMFLILVPVTILFGQYFLDDRKYNFISTLIVIECMLPFFLQFEGLKLKSKDIAIIAVLCSIGILGRAAFFMVPQFKPVVAIIIISGIALGKESGFLVGAITAFASNFFFMQGPWTPWQMLASGIIGYLAGLLFKGFLPPSKVMVCTFGGLCAFLIYGFLMNCATVLMYQPSPTFEMFIFAFIQGFPFDLIHSLSTVLFLYFCYKPFIKKIERVKLYK